MGLKQITRTSRMGESLEVNWGLRETSGTMNRREMEQETKNWGAEDDLMGGVL